MRPAPAALLLALAAPTPAPGGHGQSPEGPLALEIFDVRDLVAREGEGPRAAPPEVGKGVEALARMARTFMEPPLGDSQSIDARDGTLVVKAAAGQLEWLRTFLGRQRASRDGIVQIEVRCLTLTEAASDRLGLGQGPLLFGRPEDVSTFLERAMAEPGTAVLSAPRISAHPLQAAEVSVLTPLHFVKAYEVHTDAGPDKAAIVSPVIDTVNEGLLCEAFAGLLADDRVALDFQLTSTVVKHPIPTARTKHGMVSLPEVVTRKVGAQLRLAAGGAAVLTTPGQDADLLAVVLSARKAQSPAGR